MTTTSTDTRVVLVTGALGCIGAWTCRRLVQEGHAVVAFDLGADTRRLDQIMSPDEVGAVALEQGDIRELAAVEAVFDRHAVTHVIHLAALQIPFCRADPVLGAQVNVVGTVNIFEAARRRRDRVAGIAYTSSIGVFALTDADAATGRLAADAVARPTTLYGVYKQANEGTARVYWEESGVPSVGLRPLTVFGVGRDQGLTSGPTKAMAAAVLGRQFEVGFSGPTLYQHADDVAGALIASAFGATGGAPVVNLPGEVADGERLLAAIDAALPGAASRIRCAPGDLPLPWDIDTTGVEALGLPAPTPVEAGVRRTVEGFGELLAAGRLEPAKHGLE
jgi:nucleoside-diphosphate-sugar epimerase